MPSHGIDKDFAEEIQTLGFRAGKTRRLGWFSLAATLCAVALHFGASSLAGRLAPDSTLGGLHLPEHIVAKLASKDRHLAGGMASHLGAIHSNLIEFLTSQRTKRIALAFGFMFLGYGVFRLFLDTQTDATRGNDPFKGSRFILWGILIGAFPHCMTLLFIVVGFDEQHAAIEQRAVFQLSQAAGQAAGIDRMSAILAQHKVRLEDPDSAYLKAQSNLIQLQRDPAPEETSTDLKEAVTALTETDHSYPPQVLYAMEVSAFGHSVSPVAQSYQQKAERRAALAHWAGRGLLGLTFSLALLSAAFLLVSRRMFTRFSRIVIVGKALRR